MNSLLRAFATCLLAPLALTTPALAQTPSGAVHDAFEICRTWVEGDAPLYLAFESHPDWVGVWSDHSEPEGATRAQLTLLSSRAPLEIETLEIATPADAPNPYVARTCKIRQVDPAKGRYRYKLRLIEIGNTWDNLAPLPLDEAQRQILGIQETLRADQTLVAYTNEDRTITHGDNPLFVLCDSKRILYYDIAPKGVTGGEARNWYVSVFSDGRSSPDAEILLNCPSS